MNGIPAEKGMILSFLLPLPPPFLIYQCRAECENAKYEDNASIKAAKARLQMLTAHEQRELRRGW